MMQSRKWSGVTRQTVSWNGFILNVWALWYLQKASGTVQNAQKDTILEQLISLKENKIHRKNFRLLNVLFLFLLDIVHQRKKCKKRINSINSDSWKKWQKSYHISNGTFFPLGFFSLCNLFKYISNIAWTISLNWPNMRPLSLITEIPFNATFSQKFFVASSSPRSSSQND